MRTLAVAALVLSVTSLAAAAGAYALLDRRVEGARQKADWACSVAEPAPAPRPGPAEPSQMTLLEARLSALEDKIAALETRAPGAAPRPLSGGTAGGPAAAGEAETSAPQGDDFAGAGNAGAPRAADVARRVEALETQVRRMGERLDQEKGEAKPKFEQFAEKLNLNESQKLTMKQMLVAGQEDLVEMFQRPLPDGTVLMNQLAEAFLPGSGTPEEQQTKVQALFQRLIVEKVPGTEKTFFETAEEMNRRLSDDMGRLMTADQSKKFRSWAPKPIDIELDDGPFQRYILDYVKKREGAQGD